MKISIKTIAFWMHIAQSNEMLWNFSPRKGKLKNDTFNWIGVFIVGGEKTKFWICYQWRRRADEVEVQNIIFDA